jgi:hypothetical protein
MSKTKQELIDDIILRVTKSAPSDDLELEPRQIEFWFDLVIAEILPKWLDSKIVKGQDIPSSMIVVEDNLEATVEDVTMLNQYHDRVFIQPELYSVLDLANDGGLIRVITDQGQVVNKVPLTRLDSISKMTFGKPSRENLLHTRINDNIYIHGLSPKHVALTQFSIAYIPKIVLQDLEDDDEVPLTEEVIGLISDAVEDKALKQMYGEPDTENDAEDDNQPGK